MSRRRARAALAPLLGSALIAAALACDPPAPSTPAAASDGTGAAVNPTLAAHTAEFEKRVYRVTDRVHVAVGYALANSILIEGDDGVVVVDVTGSVESAEVIKREFDRITGKPIRMLVYTHNHADHVFGGLGFVPEESAGDVAVYAHDTTEYYIDRVVGILRPILSRRSARMFGTQLPLGDDGFVNAGIGPALEIGHGGHPGLLRPTHTFADRLELEIAGVRLVLVHAPGETNDQIFVWLPDERVLLPGDNVYKAFPNLYTIRGTLYRDVLAWSQSIDAMRALQPEHLVPSHGRPISGRDEIEGILTAYRDAIQYVHDQTIRGMNQGLSPDELVATVVLPPHLAQHPYLQELYGTVEWSVRNVFNGYLGWFDGDSAKLSPAPPEERARATIELAGGEAALLDAARASLDEGRAAWAAELATHLLVLSPHDTRARQIKAAALRELGRSSISPNGRNFYLTQALELEGELDIEEDPIDDSVLSVLRGIPIGNFMAAMPSNLDPEKSSDVDQVVGFRFPDVNETYTLHVRRGVAEFRVGPPARVDALDIGITVDSQVWKEIVVGRRNAALALASNDLAVEGGRLDLARFLGMFR